MKNEPVNLLLQKSTQYLQQGKFSEAETHLHKILESQPGHAVANNMLGIIFSEQGRNKSADQLFTIAIESSPNIPDFWNNKGLALEKQGHLEESLAAYERAIQLNQNYVIAHYNRGNVLKNLGRSVKALAAYEKVIQLNPTYAEAHSNKSYVLFGNGSINRALAACETALQLRPTLLEAHMLHGDILQRKGDLEGALTSYEKIIRITPKHAEAHNNLAVLYYYLGRPDEAISASDRAIKLKPGFTEAYINRGNALRNTNRFEEALSTYGKAVELSPNLALVHNNLGGALKSVGRLNEAEKSYRRALELKPEYAEAHSNMLFCLNYHQGITPEAMFEAHRDWFFEHAQALTTEPLRTNIGNSDKHRRLRVGYVSADFRDHSVAYFFEPLLAAHDSALTEVFCYANVKHPDKTTDRIRANADHWLSITGMPDEEVVKRIRGDRIDILVDLAGHTAGNRLLVFSHKPAPIQLTWLGYPNTTGIQSIDYRLTDIVADPPGESDRLNTEKLVRIENGFLCYQPSEKAAEVAGLPAKRNGYITFGSFNNFSKMTPDVIALWSRLLKSVPDSHLLLKTKPLHEKTIKENIYRVFLEHGVTRDKVELIGWLGNKSEHFELYNRVDIALDTFPYNGTTTTCEALWMGVPVVTLSGGCHASRVGASILEHVGCPEWIALSQSIYIDIAAHLAEDKEKLARLRYDLRDRMKISPLCDANTFARTVERAYRHMWFTYNN